MKQVSASFEIDCTYAKVILKRFENYDGRIGMSCDKCDDRECKHNAIKMSQVNLVKPYALFGIKWEE